jgi:hypothetical protein
MQSGVMCHGGKGLKRVRKAQSHTTYQPLTIFSNNLNLHGRLHYPTEWQHYHGVLRARFRRPAVSSSRKIKR